MEAACTEKRNLQRKRIRQLAYVRVTKRNQVNLGKKCIHTGITNATKNRYNSRIMGTVVCIDR